MVVILSFYENVPFYLLLFSPQVKRVHVNSTVLIFLKQSLLTNPYILESLNNYEQRRLIHQTDDYHSMRWLTTVLKMVTISVKFVGFFKFFTLFGGPKVVSNLL